MDVGVDPRTYLNLDVSGLAIEHSVVYTAPRKVMSPALRQVLDSLGALSAKAQNLGAVITTSSKFLIQTDNTIYFKAIDRQVVGFLKTGYRNLFYHGISGKIVEMRPLCVLDFYVHESVQRNGIGKELFDRMLLEEHIVPSRLAIDRPSQKLVNFMRKHYHLSNFVPQNNNFVIFNEFFESTPSPRDLKPAVRLPPQKQAETAQPRPVQQTDPAPSKLVPYRPAVTARILPAQQRSNGVKAVLANRNEVMYETSSSRYGAGLGRPSSSAEVE